MLGLMKALLESLGVWSILTTAITVMIVLSMTFLVLRLLQRA